MDNVTHGLAGLLLADITIAAVARRTGQEPSRGFRRAAVLLGVIAAEFPDADILYSGPVLGMGKLGYLLHHRGHTHTVIFAVLIALALWGVTLLLRRDARRAPERWPLLALALVGTLSHLLLDFTNSYGVHPYWPIDNRWFYGDAIFIVEPWLWMLGIPPLLFGQRSTVGRVILSLAMLGILAASWIVSIVGHDVALVLTIAAAGWLLLMRVTNTTMRLALAVGAWFFVESAGFALSSSARQRVVDATSDTRLLDAVLTSAPGNPLCQNTLVVELDGARYVVSSAVVAAWPSVRDATSCAGGEARLAAARVSLAGIGDGLAPSARPATAAMAWKQEWSAPVDELVTLAEQHCEVAAALQFMRAPVWEITPERVRLSDLRYGFGGDGFADVEFAATPTSCPPFVPGWTPPRSDVLESSSSSGGT
jgi:inner membrane protein